MKYYYAYCFSILLLSTSLLVFPINLSAEDKKNTPQDQKDIIQTSEESKDTDMEFYGIIKDQYGAPVVDAEITAGVSYFDLTAMYFQGRKTVKSKTNSNGYFEIKNIRGKHLTIRTIEKNGYAFRDDNDPQKSFDYYNRNPKYQSRHNPDKNNPVVFILHKKPEPGFVVDKAESGIIDEKGELFYVNLIKGFAVEYDVKSNKQWQTDFVFSIRMDEKKENFILDIKAKQETDGFVNKEGEPCIAPAEGYQPSITRVLKAGDNFETNYYYKSTRASYGVIYVRLWFRLNVGKKTVRMDAHLYTNIASDRNLEFDKDYTSSEMSKFAGRKIEYISDEYRKLIPQILMQNKAISTTTTTFM